MSLKRNRECYYVKAFNVTKPAKQCKINLNAKIKSKSNVSKTAPC